MKNYLFSKGDYFQECYQIEFCLKSGLIESYRVKDRESNSNKLLKIYKYPIISELEQNHRIEILRSIHHPNVLRLENDGIFTITNTQYIYTISNYISGQSLYSYLKSRVLSYNDVIRIIVSIANGLNYLHRGNQGILHNNLSPRAIWLDFSKKVHIPVISGLDYASYSTGEINHNFKKESQEQEKIYFFANEVLEKSHYSEKSDQFSLGAILYYLFEAQAPWEIVSNHVDVQYLLLKREQPLLFVNTPPAFQKVILKSLHFDPNKRFSNIKTFIEAIYAISEGRDIPEEIVLPTDPTSAQLKNNLSRKESIDNKLLNRSSSQKKPIGFAAIAGMEELKEIIQVDIIDALKDKQRYEKYGLTIPNGMLLYGPPGCGKTFFAEKMAEEIGFSFYSVKPSDIQSKWVNASQENLKNLFEKARKNAPSIVFIDELDAIAVSRDGNHVSHMNSSLVNELLVQINNCGKDDVFVIGATNRYDAIDQALLRKGRLDKHIYLPPPDYEARKGIFELHLSHRPLKNDINYDELAENSSNLVSSHLKFVCDEAARRALKLHTEISQSILLEVLAEQSISK